MSNTVPFNCKLIDGSSLNGVLTHIDSQRRRVHYSPPRAADTNTLHISFNRISHLYYYHSHREMKRFEFKINFQDNSQLHSNAELYRQDSAGHHLYNISNEDTTIQTHLFIPKESGHQLSIERDSVENRHTTSSANIVKIVEQMIYNAIDMRASDIHLRPLDSALEVRYRIDGSMLFTTQIEHNLSAAVVSRVKILGDMDIAEHRLPQDGAHHLSYKKRQVDLRISTIPVHQGESVVIRILDPKTGLRTLSEVGFRHQDEKLFRHLLHRNSGLILVTGPTGSGKSTTLYAAMRALRDREINIISIEDPVEYRLDGVRQIEINEAANNTFAKNLRHVLRHDPDVILIGEIRDRETAEIALQSAYTGHLVLSTLHSGDATSTIPRLLEMGMEPYMLKDTLLGILSQRLVRKTCSSCSGEHDRVESCSLCSGSGFYGRTPIYELLKMDSDIQDLIKNGVTAKTIRKVAIDGGMIPIQEHAKTLLKKQITTTEEIPPYAKV
ncbi:MAG: type II/IV secretion system protein [Thiotrichales bacterium]|nr:type II/IV secretion system protein [Thiotrichales bacterium]MBT3613770.1 type II/IV secretion system protein [Thiotrichales bacterium]MBT3753210.1 type II/IV secretion system protein [Thiotrichales bacterium]MBT3837885.1 type II/IV secretion system protein [Thiotrichales bacterium]MBT4152062.1 type II/IV secretion system protein [Thiotrichales bacterium]